MQKVVTSAQMKAIDSYSIEEIGIPSMVLMERAAIQVVNVVKQHSNPQDKILAVCGTGNNGGDGIAAARILKCEGYEATVLLVGDESKASEQAKEQLKIARNLGISILNNINISEYTIIIDGLLGIGLNKPVTGIYEEIIKTINSGKHLVFAVDIPSGLSADSAKPLNIAVKADYTITFGYQKVGLILYPGCEYAGEVVVADIGFPQAAFDAVSKTAGISCSVYDDSDKKKLPIRHTYSNKGTYGKVLIIAGSYNMSGACYLSAKAAYSCGAGLVKVMTVEENRVIMQQLLPEALLYTYSSETLQDSGKIEEMIEQIHWATSIVIGPGIGVNPDSERLLNLAITYAKAPLLIDADGLNILASMNRKKDEAVLLQEDIINMLPKDTLLTPHIKELSRLINMPVEEITSDLLEVADKCTINNELIFVIKDPRTVAAYKENRYINVSGNNGMATGGSGDVLTGIIGGFIAGGLSSWEAAKLGVYIHGLAGDKAAEKKGCYSMMASDIIEALPEVIEE
ncbi:NAD(P)H-hydrate dehydratase [Anaerocolumna aminovalerica]|uniref:NAD(P)H-hydrate dehydratase n=1 Tax=Anaerocolumna aminovalerica TaxID=1527 RepID=UPI000BE23A31|nr:NAD(P)H-hydrate dehydratase [Anaerocolumna aminovalerica]